MEVCVVGETTPLSGGPEEVDTLLHPLQFLLPPFHPLCFAVSLWPGLEQPWNEGRGYDGLSFQCSLSSLELSPMWTKCWVYTMGLPGKGTVACGPVRNNWSGVFTRRKETMDTEGSSLCRGRGGKIRAEA